MMDCPACGCRPAESFSLIEKHHDRIGKKDYTLLRCPECRVIFTDPPEPVGAEWYARAFASGIIERAVPRMEDWKTRNFRSHDLAHGRLIDIGCGDGGFMLLAKELGFEVRGFDFDPDAVKKAAALGLQVECSDFDAFFSRTERDGSADVLTLFDVLEHVPKPAALLPRLKKIVKPGGHIIFTMPDDRRPHPWKREELDYPPNHFTRWTPESLTGFLERQGLTVVLMTSQPIDARFLAGQAFFNFLMPKSLPWVKGLFFGRSAETGKSITQQYESARTDSESGGRMADKGFRQRLVDGAFRIFLVILFPIWWAAALRHRLAGRGHTLYALARVEP